ncbi:MAG: GC-type dockerin domain-anchored protein [Phycisphaerales bacterium JB040]
MKHSLASLALGLIATSAVSQTQSPNLVANPSFEAIVPSSSGSVIVNQAFRADLEGWNQTATLALTPYGSANGIVNPPADPGIVALFGNEDNTSVSQSIDISPYTLAAYRSIFRLEAYMGSYDLVAPDDTSGNDLQQDYTSISVTFYDGLDTELETRTVDGPSDLAEAGITIPSTGNWSKKLVVSGVIPDGAVRADLSVTFHRDPDASGSAYNNANIDLVDFRVTPINIAETFNTLSGEGEYVFDHDGGEFLWTDGTFDTGTGIESAYAFTNGSMVVTANGIPNAGLMNDGMVEWVVPVLSGSTVPQGEGFTAGGSPAFFNYPLAESGAVDLSQHHFFALVRGNPGMVVHTYIENTENPSGYLEQYDTMSGDWQWIGGTLDQLTQVGSFRVDENVNVHIRDYFLVALPTVVEIDEILYGPVVGQAPEILAQPAPVAFGEQGEVIRLTIDAEGARSYLWHFNGAPISDGPSLSGSQTDALEISVASVTEGEYYCVASNHFGQTQSDSAFIFELEPADPCTIPNTLYFNDFDAAPCPADLYPVRRQYEVEDRLNLDGDSGNMCLALSDTGVDDGMTGYVLELAPAWLPNTYYEVTFDAMRTAISGGFREVWNQVALTNKSSTEVYNSDFSITSIPVIHTAGVLESQDFTLPGVSNGFYDSYLIGHTFRFITGTNPPSGPVTLILREKNTSESVFIDNLRVTATPSSEAGLPTGRDFVSKYGQPAWVQSIGTSEQSNSDPSVNAANGSELNAVYTRVEGDSLYIGLAGNLDTINEDAVDVFVDFGLNTDDWRDGRGTGWLHENLPSSGGVGAISRMSELSSGDGTFGPDGKGLVFEPGFHADLHVALSSDGSNLNLQATELRNVVRPNGKYRSATMSLASGNLAWFLLNVEPQPNEYYSTIDNPLFIMAAIDNSNMGGVGRHGDPNESDPATVDTGIEIRIDGLAALGSPYNNDGTQAFRITAFISSGDRSEVSNQIVGGSSVNGNPLGDPRLLNLRAIPEKQYVLTEGDQQWFDTVEYPHLVLAGRPEEINAYYESNYKDYIDITQATLYAGGPYLRYLNGQVRPAELRDLVPGNAVDSEPIRAKTLLVEGPSRVVALFNGDQDAIFAIETLEILPGGRMTLQQDFSGSYDAGVLDTDFESGEYTDSQFSIVDLGEVVVDGLLEIDIADLIIRAGKLSGAGEIDGTFSFGSSVRTRLIWTLDQIEDFEFAGTLAGMIYANSQIDCNAMLVRDQVGLRRELVMWHNYNKSFYVPSEMWSESWANFDVTLWDGIRFLCSGINELPHSLRMLGDCRITAPREASLEMRIAGDLSIGDSSYIGADYAGSPNGYGSIGDRADGGTCHYSVYGGSGHGGSGGLGVANSGQFLAPGADELFIDPRNPMTFGSGASCPGHPHGAGGGLLRVFVNGHARIDGSLRANAETIYGSSSACQGSSLGGAAGGAVLLSADHISGTGIVSANGAPGEGGLNSAGGGGGGGVIALHANSYDFEITQLSVAGGSAATRQRFGYCGDSTVTTSYPGEDGVANKYLSQMFPCPPDVNRDGIVDNGDISAYVALFLVQDPIADFTGDGIIDNGDISAFVAAFLAGC